MPVPDPVPMLINDEQGLQQLCGALAGVTLLALDTEFLRTDTYTPLLCLVQIAVDGRIFCLDELAGLDTGPLWQTLAQGPGLPVLHAAKQDLEVIRTRHGVLLPALFDTQVGAALLGHPPQIGYAGLVQALLGVTLDKAHTRADWSRRPLNDALLRYAAEDVLYLPELYVRLRSALEAAGRYAWAVEDSMRLLDPALYENPPEDAWRRLAGLTTLSPEAQARARRLAGWREARAARQNRPRQWILSDRAILDIARRAPADARALAACDDVPAGVVRRQGEALLAELAQADTDFRADPQGQAGTEAPAALDQAEYRRLARVVSGIAAGLGISAEVLATRKDISALMRGEPALRILQGWRHDVVGRPLLEAKG